MPKLHVSPVFSDTERSTACLRLRGAAAPSVVSASDIIRGPSIRPRFIGSFSRNPISTSMVVIRCAVGFVSPQTRTSSAIVIGRFADATASRMVNALPIAPSCAAALGDDARPEALPLSPSVNAPRRLVSVLSVMTGAFICCLADYAAGTLCNQRDGAADDLKHKNMSEQIGVTPDPLRGSSVRPVRLYTPKVCIADGADLPAVLLARTFRSSFTI